MQYRQFGRTGLFVSCIGLGTATFGGADHPVYRNIGGLGQAEADELVGIALDAGVNLFDTADVYAAGESEQRLGRALGSRRHAALIATKIGNRLGSGPNDTGLSRVHIVAGVDGALRRLGTEHIDILQLHTFDPLSPLDEVLRSLDDLVRQGKVRYLACSNFFAWQIMKAQATAATLGVERFSALQAYYSLASRDIEREIIPALHDQGMALLTWCPLSGGLLTGKYRRDSRPTDAARRVTFDFPPVEAEHGYRIIDALEQVAARHGATIAQVALAWQYAQPAVTAAIVGARTTAQLRDNLGSVDVRLAPEDLAALEAVSALRKEYPRWYQEIPLGRLPGEASGIGNRRQG